MLREFLTRLRFFFSRKPGRSVEAKGVAKGCGSVYGCTRDP
jgi:hypothetical protein